MLFRSDIQSLRPPPRHQDEYLIVNELHWNGMLFVLSKGAHGLFEFRVAGALALLVCESTQ